MLFRIFKIIKCWVNPVLNHIDIHLVCGYFYWEENSGKFLMIVSEKRKLNAMFAIGSAAVISQPLLISMIATTLHTALGYQ